jgi:hypothetical protein
VHPAKVCDIHLHTHIHTHTRARAHTHTRTHTHIHIYYSVIIITLHIHSCRTQLPAEDVRLKQQSSLTTTKMGQDKEEQELLQEEAVGGGVAGIKHGAGVKQGLFGAPCGAPCGLARGKDTKQESQVVMTAMAAPTNVPEGWREYKITQVQVNARQNLGRAVGVSYYHNATLNMTKWSIADPEEKKGKRPGEAPVQKGSGSIAKKKPDPKAEAVTTPKVRKPKASKGSTDFQDDDALIASLICCATGSEKKEKEERHEDLDMELVAALAAEGCLPSRHDGCDGRYMSVETVRCGGGGGDGQGDGGRGVCAGGAGGGEGGEGDRSKVGS